MKSRRLMLGIVVCYPTPYSLPARERRKPIAIWHPNPRQGLGVNHLVIADDAIELQNIGYHGIDFVIAQRLRVIKRHGAAHVVKNSRRVWPETPNCLDWHLIARERLTPADQRIIRPSGSLLAVTGKALCRVDRFPLLRRPVAGRQAAAVGVDADVPGQDFFGRGNAAQVWAVSRC